MIWMNVFSFVFFNITVMMRFVITLVVFIWAFVCIDSDKGIRNECRPFLNSSLHVGPEKEQKFYNGDMEYSHVEVRVGTAMFYWLYYAAGDKSTAYEKPLIIWIQGGPGIPASGVGNFEEIGPQDINLNNRTTSWVHKRNVLFIDSPVGTGFSTVNDSSLLAKSDEEMAKDLVELMKQFLTKFPGFGTVPTHIFSQSYGAKVAAHFAYHLHEAVEGNEMILNLKSLAMGNVYVPRLASVAFPKYLKSMGLIDLAKYEVMKNDALEIVKALENGQYERAYDLRNELQFGNTSGVKHLINFYNIFTADTFLEHYPDWFIFMNESVPNCLFDCHQGTVCELRQSYLDFEENVRNALKSDLMKSPTDIVEKLLNETKITIVVYNGMLDEISPVESSIEWANGLNWVGSEEFRKAERYKIAGNNGLYKTFDRLSFWWIFNAGLSVKDNPEAMEHILNFTVDSVTKVK